MGQCFVKKCVAPGPETPVGISISPENLESDIQQNDQIVRKPQETDQEMLSLDRFKALQNCIIETEMKAKALSEQLSVAEGTQAQLKDQISLLEGKLESVDQSEKPYREMGITKDQYIKNIEDELSDLKEQLAANKLKYKKKVRMLQGDLAIAKQKANQERMKTLLEGKSTPREEEKIEELEEEQEKEEQEEEEEENNINQMAIVHAQGRTQSYGIEEEKIEELEEEQEKEEQEEEEEENNINQMAIVHAQGRTQSYGIGYTFGDDAYGGLPPVEECDHNMSLMVALSIRISLQTKINYLEEALLEKERKIQQLEAELRAQPIQGVNDKDGPECSEETPIPFSDTTYVDSEEAV